MELRAFNKLFATSKPLIGVVHLIALPGAPRWAGSMERVLDAALADASALVSGGADGLIVENFGDAPFFKERVPAHTVAAMAAVASEIKRRFKAVPLGVNVLRNDAASAIGVAASVGAQFIRVNVHTGVYAADQGLIEGRAAETLRLRESLRCEILIFADVNVKHAAPIGGARDAAVLAAEAVERGLADAVIATGVATGAAAPPAMLAEMRRAVSAPVIVGSGITARNVAEYARAADAFIVGTSLKRGGVVTNRVDAARVRELVSTVRRLRPKTR